MKPSNDILTFIGMNLGDKPVKCVSVDPPAIRKPEPAYTKHNPFEGVDAAPGPSRRKVRVRPGIKYP